MSSFQLSLYIFMASHKSGFPLMVRFERNIRECRSAFAVATNYTHRVEGEGVENIQVS